MIDYNLYSECLNGYKSYNFFLKIKDYKSVNSILLERYYDLSIYYSMPSKKEWQIILNTNIGKNYIIVDNIPYLIRICSYKNGEKDGICKEYQFLDYRKDSLNKTYLFCKGVYSNGFAIGEWTYYYRNNEIVLCEFYNNKGHIIKTYNLHERYIKSLK